MEDYEELLKAGYKYDIQNGGAITDSQGRYVASVTIKGKTYNSDISEKSFSNEIDVHNTLVKSGKDPEKMTARSQAIAYEKIKLQEYKAKPTKAPTPDPENPVVQKAHEELKIENEVKEEPSYGSTEAMVQGEEEGTIFEDITDIGMKNKYKKLQQEKDELFYNNPIEQGKISVRENKDRIKELEAQAEEEAWYNPMWVLHKLGAFAGKLETGIVEGIGGEASGMRNKKAKAKIDEINRQMKEIEKPGAIMRKKEAQDKKEAIKAELEARNDLGIVSLEADDYNAAINKLQEEEDYYTDIIDENYIPRNLYRWGNVSDQITRGFGGLLGDVTTELKLKLDIEDGKTLTPGQMALANAQEYVQDNAKNREKYEQNFINQTASGLNQSILFMRGGKGGRVLGTEAATLVAGKGAAKSIVRGGMDVGIQALVTPLTYTAAIKEYAGDIHVKTNPETGEAYATTDLHTYRTFKRQAESQINAMEETIRNSSDEHLKNELRATINEVKGTLGKMQADEPMSGAKSLVYGFTESAKEAFSETYFGNLAGKAGNKIGKKFIDKTGGAFPNNAAFRAFNKSSNYFNEKLAGGTLSGGRRLIGSTVEEMGEEVFNQLVPTVGNYTSVGDFGNKYYEQVSQLATADWWTAVTAQTLAMTKGSQAVGWAHKNMTEIQELGVGGYREKQAKKKAFNKSVDDLSNFNLTEEQFQDAFIKTGTGDFNIQDYNNTITELRSKNLHEEANQLEQDKIYKQAVFASQNGSLEQYRTSMRAAQKNENLTPETKTVLKNLEKTVDEMLSDKNNYLNANEVIEMKSRRRFSVNSLPTIVKQQAEIAPPFHTELATAMADANITMEEIKKGEKRDLLESINKKLSPEASRLLALETIKIQVNENITKYNEVINDLTSDEKQEKIRETKKYTNQIDEINRLAFKGKMTMEQFEAIIPILDDKKVWLSETRTKYGSDLTQKEKKEVQDKYKQLLALKDLSNKLRTEQAKRDAAKAQAEKDKKENEPTVTATETVVTPPSPPVVEKPIVTPDVTPANQDDKVAPVAGQEIITEEINSREDAIRRALEEAEEEVNRAGQQSMDVATSVVQTAFGQAINPDTTKDAEVKVEPVAKPEPKAEKPYEIRKDIDTSNLTVHEHNGEFIIGNLTPATETSNPTMLAIVDKQGNTLRLKTQKEAEDIVKEIQNSKDSEPATTGASSNVSQNNNVPPSNKIPPPPSNAATVVDEDELDFLLPIDQPSDRMIEELKKWAEVFFNETGKVPTYEDYWASVVKGMGGNKNVFSKFMLEWIGAQFQFAGLGKNTWAEIWDKNYVNSLPIALDAFTIAGELNEVPTIEETNTNAEKQNTESEKASIIAVETPFGISPNTGEPLMNPAPGTTLAVNDGKTSTTSPKGNFTAILYHNDVQQGSDGSVILEKKDQETSVPSLNTESILDVKELLGKHKNNPGNILQVRVTTAEDWGNPRLKVADVAPNGMVIEYISFVDWIERHRGKLSVEEFSKTQAFADKVPMLYHDNNGVDLMHVPDTDWYNPLNLRDIAVETGAVYDVNNPPESLKQAIAEGRKTTSKLRAQILNGTVKEAEILEKKGSPLIKLPANLPSKTLAEIATDNRVVIFTGTVMTYLSKKPIEDNIVIINQKSVEEDFKKNQVHTNYYLSPVYIDTKTGVQHYIALNVLRKNENNEQKAFTEDIETAKNIMAAHLLLFDPKSFPKVPGMTLEKAKKLQLEISKLTGGKIDIGNISHVNGVINGLIALQGTSTGGNKPQIYTAVSGSDRNKKIPYRKNGKIDTGYFQDVLFVHEANLYTAIQNTGENPNTSFGLKIALDTDGNFVTELLADNYEDFLKKRLSTNVISYNMGTEEKPQFTSSVQPIIKMGPIVLKETPSIQQVENTAPAISVGTSIASPFGTVVTPPSDIDSTATLSLGGLSTEEKKETPKENMTSLSAEEKQALEEARDLLRSMNSLNEFESDMDLQLPTMEDVTMITEALKNIGGLSSAHQAEVVNLLEGLIYTHYSPKKIKGQKSYSVLVKEDFDKIYTDKLNELEEKKIAIEGLLSRFPKDAGIASLLGNLNSTIANSKAVVDNFNTLFNIAEKEAIRRNLIKESKGTDTVSDDENIDDDETLNVKDFSSESNEVIHKEKVSAPLKRIFSRVFTENTGFLGAKIPTPFDVTYNMIATFLTSPLPTDPTFDAMISKLKQLNLPWVEPLIKDLNDAPIEVKNGFVTNMYKYAANAKFVMFTQSKDGSSGEVWFSNANTIDKKIKDSWYSNFKASEITNGDFLNPDKLKELVATYDKWGTDKVNGSTNEEKRKWLSQFGIVLSDQTWEEMLKGNFIKAGKYPRKLPFETLFADTTSAEVKGEFLFSHLYKFAKIHMNSTSKDLNFTENPDKLNPFRDMNHILKGLLNLESKYNSTIVNITRRVGGKTVSELVFPSMFLETMNKLKKSAEGFNTHIDDLKTTAFAKNSLFLELLSDPNSEFASIFNYGEVDLVSLKNLHKDTPSFANIDEISAIDYIYHQRAMFQDLNTEKASETKDMFNMRVATVSTPTNSDKGRMMLVKTFVYDLFGASNSFETDFSNEEVKFSDTLKEMLFKRLVEPELDRILQPLNGINLKKYDKGAARFNVMPLLNTVQVDGTTTLDFIEEALAKQNQSGESTEDIKKAFKDMFFNPMTASIEAVMQDEATEELNEISTFLEEAKLKTGVIDIINNKAYLEKGKKYNTAQKKRAATLDYIINYTLTNMNVMQTISGDPALYYDSGIDPRTGVEADQVSATYLLGVNMGKRMAAMIAPGSVLANSVNEKYIQLMLEDTFTVAPNAELIIGWHYGKQALSEKPKGIDLTYQQILDKLRNGDYKQDRDNVELSSLNARFDRVAAFFEIESTDGQEYTTLNEHLRVLEGLGRISPEKKKEIQDKVEKGESLEKDLDVLLQPLKPVYTGSTVEKGVNRMYYIKCSSFPLIPDLVKGTYLEPLMNKMNEAEKKRGMTVRAAYMSAVKVGGTQKGVNIFSQAALDELDAANEAGTAPRDSVVLDRINFKIQQDVPFKSDKEGDDMVSMGTQIFKHLFGDGVAELVIKDEEGNVTFNGPKLKDEFFEVFSEMITLNKDSLLDSLALDGEFKSVDKHTAMKKLEQLLLDEAEARGFSENDKKGLTISSRKVTKPNGEKVIEYFPTQPIWLSGNSNKIEAMFNAIINNKIFKQKIPGNAAVVGSANGLTLRDQTAADRNGIVYIGDYRGEELKGGQVLAPSKIKLNGVLINLFEKVAGEYVYIKKQGNGFVINEDKIDPALFENFSFRTPTSSLGSGATVEIVGFLPDTLGDLMITPSNFVAQMGQDFDIDKLTNYQYHHHLNPETGRIEKLTQAHVDQIISEMRFNLHTLITEGADQSKIDKAQKRLDNMPKKMQMKLAQNKFIEIHNAVYKADSPEIQKKINKVLSMDYNKRQANAIDTEKNKNKKGVLNLLSPVYNRKKLMSGSTGGDAIAIYAKASTLNSMAQQTKEPLMIGSTDKDGKFTSSTIQIGGLVSNGEIGKFTLKDGTKIVKSLSVEDADEVELFLARSRAEVIDERVNTGTDNEKAQVLGRVGIVDLKNVAVDSGLLLRGISTEIRRITEGQYDKNNPTHKTTFYKGEPVYYTEYDIPYLLHSQPIIQEYLKRLKNSKAIIGEVPAKGTDLIIFNEMLDGYVSDKSLRKEMTGENLFASLSGPVNNNGQKEILILYRQLMDEGGSLKELQQLVDMSNLGKSMWESKEKIENFIDLVTGDSVLSSSFQGIADLLGTTNTGGKGIYLDHNVWFEPTTNQGVMVGNAVSLARNLFYDYFPYYDDYISAKVENIVRLSGRTSNLAEFRETIFEQIKKYITSNEKNGLLGESAEAVREALMFNKNGNESLGRYISKIKSIPSAEQTPGVKELLSNSLFKALSSKLGENGQADTVDFDMNVANANDESLFYTAFKELLVSDAKLPGKNGEEYSIRRFAQELVALSHASGGVISEATQYHKYIPIEYYQQFTVPTLTKAGTLVYPSVTRVLQDYNPLIKNWAENRRLEFFEEQFLQHFPENAPRLTEDMQKIVTFTNKQGFSPKSSDFKLEPFYAMPIKSKKKGKKGVKTKASKWAIYKHTGNGSYVRIPVLGGSGMTEYDYSKPVKQSLIEEPLSAEEQAALQESVEIQHQVEVTNGSFRLDQQAAEIGEQEQNMSNAQQAAMEAALAEAEAEVFAKNPPQAPIIPQVQVFETADENFQFLENDTAQTILERIRENIFAYNPSLNELAGTLLEVFKDQVNNTKIVLDPLMVSRGGSTPGVININPTASRTAEVFVHEFLHSVTTEYLNNFIDFKTNTIKEGIDIPPAVKEMIEVYEEYNAQIKLKHKTIYDNFYEKRAKRLAGDTSITFSAFELSVVYPTVNLKEFLAISLSNNTEFLKEASKIKYKGTSMSIADKFKKVLQRLFDGMSVIENNLAEQIVKVNLNLVDTVAETNRTPQQINGAELQAIIDETKKKDPMISPFGTVVSPDIEIPPPNVESGSKNPFGQPLSRQEVEGELKEGEGTKEELAKIKEIESKPENTKTGFTYKGVFMETDFAMGNEQIEALERAIDHVLERKNTVLTIQGSAGTGKTTIIGLLSKYLEASGNRRNAIHFMSPTHAANVQLALANLKNGITDYPSTIKSALRWNRMTKQMEMNKKLVPSFKRPVYIIDEASMLSHLEVKNLKKVVEDVGGVIIYLGDIAQIPSTENISGELTSVFLSEPKIILNKVYRQSPNTLLKILTKIRNNAKMVTYRVLNGDSSLQFKSKVDFDDAMYEDFTNSPETTAYIAYTKEAVKKLNREIKEAMTGTINIRIGDKIVGYLGYQSKSPMKSSVSNAINYIIKDFKIEKNHGEVTSIKLTLHSDILQSLKNKGVDTLVPSPVTTYIPLSAGDSLQHEGITQEAIDKNNEVLSSNFKETFTDMFVALQKQDWKTFYSKEEAISSAFTNTDLGGDYVYNIITNKFEPYNKTEHENLYGKNVKEFTIEKGIDFGYGITAHKAQGMTLENVYVDIANIQQKGKNTPVLGVGGKVINTEKNTLYYVAMSRASKKTVISTTGVGFDEFIDETPMDELPDVSQKSVPLGNPIIANPEILMPNNIKPCSL